MGSEKDVEIDEMKAEDRKIILQFEKSPYQGLFLNAGINAFTGPF